MKQSKDDDNTKSRIFPIRFDQKFFSVLEEEAKKARRTVSDYIRFLIETHQDRQKKE